MKKPRVGPAMSPAQFKAIRKRLGLSQEGIAREIDRSFVTVNRMEQGHTPVDVETAGRLRALAKKA
jgi:transcriptional regulator with XRE-family HTH domain